MKHSQLQITFYDFSIEFFFPYSCGCGWKMRVYSLSNAHISVYSYAIFDNNLFKGPLFLRCVCVSFVKWQSRESRHFRTFAHHFDSIVKLFAFRNFSPKKKWLEACKRHSVSVSGERKIRKRMTKQLNKIKRWDHSYQMTKKVTSLIKFSYFFFFFFFVVTIIMVFGLCVLDTNAFAWTTLTSNKFPVLFPIQYYSKSINK